jgi:hypothetical protein
MALDGAVLVARGSGDPGEQPNPVIAQYQVSAVDGLASTAITPLSTNGKQMVLGGPVVHISGHQQPGNPTPKPLIEGVIQNATDLLANESPLGNTLPSSTGVGLVPTQNPAQAQSAGLSLSPEHE